MEPIFPAAPVSEIVNILLLSINYILIIVNNRILMYNKLRFKFL